MNDRKNIFEWDQAKFTTYVDSMDKEHQGLISIMNQLYQMNEKGAGKSQLLKLVDELGAKTTEHFAHEEKLMDGITNYKGQAVHRQIHRNLLENYVKHAELFRSGADTKLPIDFFNFLKVWLSAHICGIDRKYGEAAKAG